jgi:serpin B
MSKTWLFPVSVVLCLGFLFCDRLPFAPEGLNWRDLTLAEMQLVESDNSFGLKLFREVNTQEGVKNIFISPLSVSMALGMTYNGAAGTTEQAMRSTLEYGGMTLEDINESYQGLTDLLLGLDPEVTLEIANSIWYRKGLPVERDFVKRTSEYFGALVTGLDFSAAGAASKINDWVSESTNGKIEEIVDDPIDPSLVMFLINAIYFKGTWTYQFEKNQTKNGDFTLSGGSRKTVKMMTLEGDLDYSGTESFQAVDLPYGGEAFSMTVILPGEDQDLDLLVSEISQETWDGWVSGFEETQVHLEMPKFTLEYELLLNDVLTALGMGEAFDEGNADFSGICRCRELLGENMYISKVKHKTFVQVDEEGTEAAAVTSVEMAVTGDSGPIQMRVDKPFLFAIREHMSGTILFMGKIVDPEFSS